MAGINKFVVIGVIFVLIGIVGIFLGVALYMQSAATTSWPSTQGTVTNSTVNSTFQCTNNANNGNSCNWVYTPLVTYDYSVAGVPYVGHSITLDGTGQSSSDSYAYSEVAMYPAGGNVTVYYNANSPSSAVLETGAGLSDLILPVLGAIFLVAGIIVTLKGVALMYM